jgi:hypothetical protein
MARKQPSTYKERVEARIVKPSQNTTPPRFLVYSRNKKGKTTFGVSAGIDQTLVLDPENGTKEMKEKDPNVFHIEEWEDMELAWGYLRSGDHPYTWVVVDGLTKINNLALNYVRRVEEERNLDRQPGMIDRRDYNKSGELMKQMLTNFQGLRLGIVYTAQERMMTLKEEEILDEDASSVFYVPDLPAGVRGTVNSYVDVIGRLFVEKVPDKEGVDRARRRLQIGVHDRFDTGYRSDFVLPDVLKSPTVPKLVRLIREGE